MNTPLPFSPLTPQITSTAVVVEQHENYGKIICFLVVAFVLFVGGYYGYKYYKKHYGKYKLLKKYLTKYHSSVPNIAYANYDDRFAEIINSSPKKLDNMKCTNFSSDIEMNEYVDMKNLCSFLVEGKGDETEIQMLLLTIEMSSKAPPRFLFVYDSDNEIIKFVNIRFKKVDSTKKTITFNEFVNIMLDNVKSVKEEMMSHSSMINYDNCKSCLTIRDVTSK
jgi:hypothetical protein